MFFAPCKGEIQRGLINNKHFLVHFITFPFIPIVTVLITPQFDNYEIAVANLLKIKSIAIREKFNLNL